MNILPKKSWHVLSRKNVERVRQDEANEKAKEEEKAQRALLAEQEARVTLLRKRARERDGEEEEKGEKPHGSRADRRPEGREVIGTEGGHINFFADVEKGVGLQLTNAEHEAEKKAEQEKVEKRIGLLNYLVDKDKSDPEPWYVRTKSSKGEPSAKSEHRKKLMDPLAEMRHYVSAKKKCVRSEEGSTETYTTKLRVQKTQTEHGKHKSSSSKLEELRRERRKREEAERSRSEALLRKHYGGEGSSSSAAAQSGPRAVEELPGRYNSQYNPHLARHW